MLEKPPSWVPLMVTLDLRFRWLEHYKPLFVGIEQIPTKKSGKL